MFDWASSYFPLPFGRISRSTLLSLCSLLEVSTLRCLLQLRADPSIKDVEGRTAAELAREEEKDDAYGFLKLGSSAGLRWNWSCPVFWKLVSVQNRLLSLLWTFVAVPVCFEAGLPQALILHASLFHDVICSEKLSYETFFRSRQKSKHRQIQQSKQPCEVFLLSFEPFFSLRSLPLSISCYEHA